MFVDNVAVRRNQSARINDKPGPYSTLFSVAISHSNGHDRRPNALDQCSGGFLGGILRFRRRFTQTQIADASQQKRKTLAYSSNHYFTVILYRIGSHHETELDRLTRVVTVPADNRHKCTMSVGA